MDNSAASCTGSAYQPVIFAFQGEDKNLIIILEEGKGFLSFIYISMHEQEQM